MYDAKKVAVRDAQLRHQELLVPASDLQIYAANGGNGKFTIGEALKAVHLVIQKDDSANALVHFAAASIAISGSNSDEIVVTGLALAANDVAIIRYELA